LRQFETFYEALVPLFDGTAGAFEDWMGLKSRRIEWEFEMFIVMTRTDGHVLRWVVQTRPNLRVISFLSGNYEPGFARVSLPILFPQSMSPTQILRPFIQ
jgi:hypothetical protein